MTLVWWRVFYMDKNAPLWRGFVEIFRDYPLQIHRSKLTSGDFPGLRIIPSHPLKYTRSKQGLKRGEDKEGGAKWEGLGEDPMAVNSFDGDGLNIGG
jgi:hypothetical protein